MRHQFGRASEQLSRTARKQGKRHHKRKHRDRGKHTCLSDAYRGSPACVLSQRDARHDRRTDAEHQAAARYDHIQRRYYVDGRYAPGADAAAHKYAVDYCDERVKNKSQQSREEQPREKAPYLAMGVVKSGLFDILHIMINSIKKDG